MQRSKTRAGFIAAGLTVLAATVAVVQAPVAEMNATSPPHHALFGHTYTHLAPEADSIEVLAPSVTHLRAYFNQLDYGWEQEHLAVPRVALTSFPSDMDEVPEVNEKKRLFFESMLPLVLMETERIASERAHMLALFEKTDRGEALSDLERDWLNQLAKRYKIAEDPMAARAELRLRVNVVPISLALAMAATESGWGTSRFAEEGNNLFGQWTFTPGTGLVPKQRPKGARYEVAIFPDLASSVRAYLNNLNTHWAYKEFRRIRAELPDLAAEDAGIILARSLTRYSERGVSYTDDLVRIIRSNGLARAERAILDAGIPLSRAIEPAELQASLS